MGYDMYIVGKLDADEEAAVAAAAGRQKTAMDVWREAMAASTADDKEADPAVAQARKEWDDAMEEYDRVNVGYFRLNIWGMSLCVEMMARFGMLAPSPRNLAEIPGDGWSRDLSGDDYDGLDLLEDGKTEGMDEERLARLTKVKDMRDTWLRWRPEQLGIAVHKFGSNDGWIVTPAEIEEALSVYESVDDTVKSSVTKEIGWWQRWIDWLRSAQYRQGFRVH